MKITSNITISNLETNDLWYWAVEFSNNRGQYLDTPYDNIYRDRFKKVLELMIDEAFKTGIKFNEHPTSYPDQLISEDEDYEWCY